MHLPPNHIEFRNETEIVANLEDTLRFLCEAKKDERHWKWAVYALFSAIQSAMILARGPKAVEIRAKNKSGGTAGNERQVKDFARLYEELKVEENWEGRSLRGWSVSTAWDRGIQVLKCARDDVEHPKFDGTIYPCSMLRKGCLEALEYLDYLVRRSEHLHERTGENLPRLMALLEQVRTELERLPK